LRQKEQLAFFFPGTFRFPDVKSLPEGVRLPSPLPIVARSTRVCLYPVITLWCGAAQGMIAGFAQPVLDGSVFLVREPTLPMQISHLHQHSAACYRRILTIAKARSYAKDQPASHH
jgi:hypothetical protein